MGTGLPEKEIEHLISRFNGHTADFDKNETIIHCGQHESQICFIKKGLAYLCTEDEDCSRSILRYFREGEYITPAMIVPPRFAVSYVMAKYPTKAVFFNRDELFRFISSNREWSTKFIELIDRQSCCDFFTNSFILHGKTVRAKLTAYFRYESELQGSAEIRLPIPMTDLAELLACDRSALMKELGAMKSDGLIGRKNRDITLLDIALPEQ